MHKQLDRSPDNFGTPESILSKLDLNSGLFLEALGKLSHGQNKLESMAGLVDVWLGLAKIILNSFSGAIRMVISNAAMATLRLQTYGFNEVFVFLGKRAPLFRSKEASPAIISARLY